MTVNKDRLIFVRINDVEHAINFFILRVGETG